MRDAAGKRHVLDACEPARGGCCGAARKDEFWHVGPPAHQSLVRIEQCADVLPWLERAHKQDAAIGWHVWLLSERPPYRRPRRTDVNALAGDPKPFDDLRSSVLRGGNDGVRPPRMRGRENRIIAPDLGACVLRVCEKKQIVNRDNLRSLARRRHRAVEA